MAIKDNSMLEIAIDLLEKKHKPQHIDVIIKEVLSLKGLKQAQAKEVAPQFVMDFMLSGYFVYCGDDTWDLKDRQPTSVLDKDGSDFEEYLSDDEDVKKNELKDEEFNVYGDDDESFEESNEDDEDEDEENDTEDDLAHEFEISVGDIEDLENDTDE
jgi:DNA-directed RNA polymerase subunit delta